MSACPDCGCHAEDCYCYDPDGGCAMCGGEGSFFGEETPGFRYGWDDPDRMLPCPSCRGSGLRKDMTIW